MAADSHTADALREILATCADPLNRACEEYAKLARELAEANERLSQAMRNHGEQLMALHAQRSETRRTAAALHACEGLDTVDLEANEKGWLCGLAHDAARVERDLNNAFRARCVGNTMDDDPVCCQSYEAHEQAQPCPPGCCVMADQKDVRAVLEAIEREDKPEASAPCVAVPITSSKDFQQRRGMLADTVDWAIAEYDGFMLDDDYNAQGALDRIARRLREVRDMLNAGNHERREP